MLSNNLLGTKFKVVLGYAGATEVSLAVEKGEVEGEAGKDWTTLTSTKPQWIRDKQINIIVQMGMRPHPDIKGVPMAIELAKSPDDRRIMEVVFAKFGMSRPFFTPPGLPPERLAMLRRAFDATHERPGRDCGSEEARHGDQPGPRRGRRGAGDADDEHAGRAGGARATP